MGKLGIIYAISRTAGEFCKLAAQEHAASKNISIDILTHEGFTAKYKEFYDDLSKTKCLVVDSVKSLSDEGAQVVFIAANSVHRVFDQVKEDVKKINPDLKLISIVEAAVKHCQANAYQNSAIFGSNSTIKSEIYQNEFGRSDIKLLPLTDKQQEDINALINAGIDNPDIEKLKLSVKNTVDQLSEQNCQSITMACTELPLLFKPSDFKIPIINTGNILAQHAVDVCAELNSRLSFRC